MTSPAAAVRRIAMHPDLSLATLMVAYGLFRAAQVLPGRLPHPVVFAILIGSGAYLAFRARFASRATRPPAATRTIFAASDILYAISLVIALLIWRQSLYAVPPYYFLTLMVAAGSILFDAMYGRDEVGGTPAVLAKVILLGILLRAMAYYQFPGPIGSDPWRHILTIETTAAAGSVIDHLPNALETHNGYSSIPVFHILAAISGNVGGISAKAAAFVAASVPQVLSVLSIFLLGRVVHGERAGLLAALLYCMADFSILWGVQVIAMTLASTIAACLLWWLLSHRTASSTSIGVSLLLIAALILCHTVSAFVMLVALASVAIVFRALKAPRFPWNGASTAPILGLSLVALYGVFMLVWWMTMPTSTGDSFFTVQAAKLANVLTTAAEVQAPSAPVGTPHPYAHVLHDASGSAVLIGLGLCAALASFTRGRRQSHLLSITIASGALISLQAVGSDRLQEAIISARWVVFQYMLLAVLSAWALCIIMSLWRGRFLRPALTIALCLVYVFPMMTNSTSNQANPFWPITTPRTGYTQSEQTAWRTMIDEMGGWPLSDGQYIGAMTTVTTAEEYARLSSSDHSLFIERRNYIASPHLNETYRTLVGDIRTVYTGYYSLGGRPVLLNAYAASLTLTGGVVYVNDTTRMVQLTT